MIRMADYFNFALYPATLQPCGTINGGRILDKYRSYDLLTHTIISYHKYLSRIIYTFIDSNNRIFGEELNVFFPLTTNKERVVSYNNNNFDKWKELYTCLMHINCKFRDVFANMVDYYVLNI
jgi:hypothetical protein